MEKKIAVIGGGVIGLSSAVFIVEHVKDIEVTLISETLSPWTTGDGSAGFWMPYLLGDVTLETLKFWCEKSLEFFQNIFNSTEASDYGIGLISAFQLYSENKIEEEVYTDFLVNWTHLNASQLALFPNKYKFRAKGGKIIQRRLNSLQELSGSYDVVINCSGIGAATLVPDPSVRPIRGQVIKVRAPWVKHAVITDDGYYILPNADEVICGGTNQVDDWNREVSLEDSERIWKGCCDLLPSLQNASWVEEWVGLRPGRSGPRLERELIRTPKGDLKVIHNYGHGGSGVTLAWGCAHQVAQILQEMLGRPSDRLIPLQ